MINRDDIRTGVETRKDPLPGFGATEPEGYQVAWASLHWRGETRITDDMDAQREQERFRRAMLHRIYGDANRAVNEMEGAVMCSLELGTDRTGIAAMCKKLREAIPLS